MLKMCLLFLEDENENRDECLERKKNDDIFFGSESVLIRLGLGLMREWERRFEIRRRGVYLLL